MLPTEGGASPSPDLSDFSVDFSASSTRVAKPLPLVSIPSVSFGFELVQSAPSLVSVGSSTAPVSLDLLSVSFPMGPTGGPDTMFSVPELPDAMRALVPFPPKEVDSRLIQFMDPDLGSSARAVWSGSKLGIAIWVVLLLLLSLRSLRATTAICLWTLFDRAQSISVDYFRL